MRDFFETDDGVKISYRIHGKGDKTVILLHGWGGNQLSFDPAISILKDRCKVVSYDHRGFGESGKPGYGYNLDRLALDLKQLIEHLKFESITLVGWSMGGVTAIVYLRNHGSKFVDSISLIDVNAKVLNDDSYQYGFYSGKYTSNEAYRDLTLISQNLITFTREMPEKGNMLLFTPDMREVFAQKVAEQNEILSLLCFWICVCEADFRDDIPDIDVPVLFMHGGTSTYCPPEACEYISDRLQLGRVAEFEECSHFIPIERPKRFAEEIIEFINE